MSELTPNEAKDVSRIRSEFESSIKGPWSYDVYGQMIMLPENNGMIATMRGWGHVTGDDPYWQKASSSLFPEFKGLTSDINSYVRSQLSEAFKEVGIPTKLERR